MSTSSTPVIDATLESAVRSFLYHEADLADRGRYREWLALWTEDDVRYWVTPREDVDPLREVSYVYDDRALLEQRVSRWSSGFAWAQVPRSLTSRIVGNVTVERGTDHVRARANVHVCVARKSRTVMIAMRVSYVLDEVANGFTIREKKVVFLDPEAPVGNITFVL